MTAMQCHLASKAWVTLGLLALALLVTGCAGTAKGRDR